MTQLPSGLESEAYAINDQGVIAGKNRISATFITAIWKDGTPVEIGSPDWSMSSAVDINNNNQVTGFYWIDGKRRSFIWQNNMMLDIGTLGGTETYASGINDSGQVVGSSKTPGDAVMKAFIYKDGVMDYLGDIPGAYDIWASDINDLGQVVGHTSGAGRTYIWQNGVYSYLSYGRPAAINNRGQVVGWSDNRAVIWIDGVAVDLNTLIPAGSGWGLYETRDINDYGQIVGYGVRSGVYYGFLLTPVPEPSSLAALLCGVGGFGVLVRRKHRSAGNHSVASDCGAAGGAAEAATGACGGGS